MKGIDDHIVCDDATVHHHFTDLLARSLLQIQRLFQLFFCDHVLFDKNVTQTHSLSS